MATTFHEYPSVLRLSAEHLHRVMAAGRPGDGAGWRDNRGFIPTLIAARRQGFGVEVVSFAASLNPALRHLAEAAGMLVELDDYYFAVTFLEGLRRPEPILLHHRAVAHPSPWQTDDVFIKAAQRAARRGMDGRE